jgi:hypothetical protein
LALQDMEEGVVMTARRTRIRLVSLVTAVGASLGLAIGVALAFNPTLSNFEIEGDLTSGIFNGGGSVPTVTGVDWADGGPGTGALLADGTDNPAEPGSAALITDPVSGNGDTSTFQASKENDNSTLSDPPPPGGKLVTQTPWTIVTGQSQPKDDLTNSYFYGLISGNQADVVVGAERTAVTGESHLDFEFNQLDWVTCPTDADSQCPQRMEGDVLVAANIDSDGVTTFYNVYVWDLPGGIDAGAGLRGSVTPASTTGCDGYAINGTKPAKFAGCPWEEVVFQANEIIGVLNQAPVAAGPWGSKDSANANRTTIPTAGMFEAFLDFDALGFPPSCPGFAKASVKTRASGEGITSSMSDLSGPVDIDLNTCATVIVKKDMVGGTASFSYTGTPNGTITTDLGTISATVAPGNYSSIEAAPPTGWSLTSIVCDDSDSTGTLATRTANFVVGNNETVTCTFTNTKQPTLTINKVCVPTTDTGLFNLREDGVTKTANAACGTGTGAFQTTIGSHTVSETAGTGTSLANYTSVISGDCTAAGAVTLAAGDNKTCTITNTRKPTLTINKVCVPTTDPGLFNLRVDGSTVTADAACGTGTGAFQTTIGSHTVSETAGTGTSLANYTSVISGDCTAAGAVTLAAGDNKTCTITNTRLFKIIVLVCNQSTNLLHPSTVTIDGVDKTSLAPGSLTPAEQAALCGLGGASYSDKGLGNHPGNVNIAN